VIQEAAGDVLPVFLWQLLEPVDIALALLLQVPVAFGVGLYLGLPVALFLQSVAVGLRHGRITRCAGFQ